jgi:hypothetical protein
MKPISHNQTTLILTELYKVFAAKAIPSNAYAYKANQKELSRELQDKKSSFVPSEFVIFKRGFLNELDPAELKMVIKIASQLEIKNLYWEYDYLNEDGGRHIRTFRSLRDKNILITTGSPTIHIVNPECIRRGEITRVIGASLNRAKKVGYITSKLILNLERHPDTVKIEDSDELKDEN